MSNISYQSGILGTNIIFNSFISLQVALYYFKYLKLSL